MSKTALVIVDLQVDYCSPEGLAASRHKKMSEIYSLLPRIQDFYIQAKVLPIEIFFTQFLFHKTKSSGITPHCVPGSKGEDFYPIKPTSDEQIVKKYHFDPFVGTGFADKLRAKKVNNIWIAGVRTELCIDMTAKRAVSEGFSVTIIEDLVATYDDNYLYHDTTLHIFNKYYGEVKQSSKLI